MLFASSDDIFLLSIVSVHLLINLCSNSNNSFSKLTKKQDIQLSLFDNYEKDEKESKLFDAMDAIQKKYGKNKLLRTSSLSKESTAKERHNQIGGHRK